MGVLMSLLKQAKTCRNVRSHLQTCSGSRTSDRMRNLANFLFSIKAGQGAEEIASLTWDMITDAEGDSRSPQSPLRQSEAKGRSGRRDPLNKDLRSALQKLDYKSVEFT